jgi:hypothetical protein
MEAYLNTIDKDHNRRISLQEVCVCSCLWMCIMFSVCVCVCVNCNRRMSVHYVCMLVYPCICVCVYCLDCVFFHQNEFAGGINTLCTHRHRYTYPCIAYKNIHTYIQIIHTYTAHTYCSYAYIDTHTCTYTLAERPVLQGALPTALPVWRLQTGPGWRVAGCKGTYSYTCVYAYVCVCQFYVYVPFSNNRPRMTCRGVRLATICT